MTSHALQGPRATHEPTVAAVAACACGAGAVLAYAGNAADQPLLLVAGGALLAAGFAFVLAGHWVDPLIALVVALPAPALYESDTARIAPALLMSGLLLAAWLLRAGAGTSSSAVAPTANTRLVMRGLMLLLGAVAFAAVFAQARLAAAREIVNWLLLAGVFLIAIDELRRSPSSRHRLALAIGMVAAVCGVVAVLQTAGVLPARFPLRGTGLQRATAGFGWPNELGMFLAIAVPYAVYWRTCAAGRWPRLLAGCGVAAVVLGLLATFSRGSWLAALLAPLVLLALGERRRVLRIWLIGLAVCLAVDVLSGGVLRDRLASTIGDWVIEQRAALTLAGVLMFAANPMAGVGPGGFAFGLDEYGPRIAWLWDYLPTAQNSYVQFAAELGLPGLAAFVAFMILTLVALLRAARGAETADRALSATALWAFATAVLVAFSEWIFAHGIGQLVLLSAAIGATGAAARPADSE